ncbi:MAG: hypothetical protein HYY06_05495 [Deltaproteobacteria bacterium]|nr:hypothetical protein [Deltaproteobacteria bacterium]
MTRVAIALALVAGCGFDTLERAPEPQPETFDDLEGAATIEGIQVLPAIIHPGDRVTLREPTRTPRGQPAAVYIWGACDGALEGNGWGRETSWVAPAEPGTYAVTVNISAVGFDEPSRVIPLCVVGDDEESCPEPGGAAPVLESLTASPGSFVQAQECAGPCETALDAGVGAADGNELRYLWTTRGGNVVGDGAAVRWLLPAVGCCTESFTAAITVCGGTGTAATGQVNVVVIPG